MEKNDWLCDNLYRKAKENFSCILENSPYSADSYMKLAEVMQLREFTFQSLMNIPIQLSRDEAEKACNKVLDKAVFNIFKLRVESLKTFKLTAKMLEDERQARALIATAAPKGHLLFKESFKSLEKVNPLKNKKSELRR